MIRYRLRYSIHIKPQTKYIEFVMKDKFDLNWKAAMHDKIKSLKDMNTWKIVNLFEGRKNCHANRFYGKS